MRGFLGMCCTLSALIAICVGFAVADAAMARKGPDRPLAARPDGPAVSPDVRPDAVMCCGRGAKRWMTNMQACRRAGGRPLPNTACRDGRRVCCKRGNGYFLATARMCGSRGGRVAPTRVCTAPNERICCATRRSYPRLKFDTRRACDQRGGQATADRSCRGGPDNRAGRVCCARSAGGHWWTLFRDCRAVGGRAVSEAICEQQDAKRADAVCCRFRDGRHSLARRSQCLGKGGAIANADRCRARGGTVRRR